LLYLPWVFMSGKHQRLGANSPIRGMPSAAARTILKMLQPQGYSDFNFLLNASKMDRHMRELNPREFLFRNWNSRSSSDEDSSTWNPEESDDKEEMLDEHENPTKRPKT